MEKSVVVVGGGIIGACTAFQLARSGARVTVVEAGMPGDGASGNSLAWVNAKTKRPHNYFELNMEGMSAHRRLVEQFGSAPWWNCAGSIHSVPASEQQSVLNVDELMSWGYRVELLGRAELALLEPSLVLPDDRTEAIFYPDEGFIHPYLLVGRLLGAARSMGADVMTNTAVSSLLNDDDHVNGVLTGSGEKITADEVVLAAGFGTPELTRGIGFDLPLVQVGDFGDNGMATRRQPLGLLVVTDKVATGIDRLVKTEDVQFRPDGAGRLLIQNHNLELELTPDTPADPFPQQAHQILAQAQRHVLGLSNATVQSVHMGVRVMPADGMPVVGRVPGLDGLYITLAHSGVTLSPVIGELAARELLFDVDSRLLADFRPWRFAVTG